jgi:hypothetical protein
MARKRMSREEFDRRVAEITGKEPEPFEEYALRRIAELEEQRRAREEAERRRAERRQRLLRFVPFVR